jgi:hypothetical protein
LVVLCVEAEKEKGERGGGGGGGGGVRRESHDGLAIGWAGEGSKEVSEEGRDSVCMYQWTHDSISVPC